MQIAVVINEAPNWKKMLTRQEVVNGGETKMGA